MKLSENNGLFKRALLGSVDDESKHAYTIGTLLKLYNLKNIEVLKIDIEGSILLYFILLKIFL